MLGQVKAHSYVIEFQKRGLPYAYILIINYSMDGVTSANVDNAVSAEIPEEATANSPEHVKRLYDIVVTNMIHKNCTTGAQV